MEAGLDLQTVAEGGSPLFDDELAHDERALNLELHHRCSVCCPVSLLFFARSKITDFPDPDTLDDATANDAAARLR